MDSLVHHNQSASMNLDTTISNIDHNTLTHDALISCIQSLKLLVSNERTISRITNRRLASAVSQLDQAQSSITTNNNDHHLQNILQQLRIKDDLLSQAQQHAHQLNDQLANALLSNHTSSQIQSESTQQKCRQCIDYELKQDDYQNQFNIIQQKLIQNQQQNSLLNDQITKEGKLRVQIELENKQIESRVIELEKEKSELIQEQKNVHQSDIIQTNQEQQKQMETLIEEKEKQVTQLTNQIQIHQSKIDSMSQALQEIPTLRKQLLETQGDKQLSKLISHLSNISDDQDIDVATLLPNVNPQQQKTVKKKLYELKIARVVINEKNKQLIEVRKQLSDAEILKQQMDVTNNEQSQVLQKTETELKSTQQDLQKIILRKDEIETSLQNASKQINDLTTKLDNAQSDLSNSEETRTVQAKKIHQLENQIEKISKDEINLKTSLQKLNSETENLRNALTKSNCKYEDLQMQNHKLRDELDNGNTSPCSTDTFAEDENENAPSKTEHTQSLAELEEASRLSKSPRKPPNPEPGSSGGSPVTRARIDSLVKSLQLARRAGSEKDQDLSDARKRISELERSERSAKANLISEREKKNSLSKLIEDKLKPRIEVLEKQLKEKLSHLKATTEEFDFHKSVAQNTRTALENEIGEISEKLENTANVLAETETKLSQAEERGAQLDNRVQELLEDKQEQLNTIENLQHECKHRHQSLEKLHDQLVTVESLKAKYEQEAINVNEDKQQMQRLLEQAYDRQNVAEKRAARKDLLLHEKEIHFHELEKNHASLVGHITENVTRIQKDESEIEQLSECVREKDSALQEQALLAREREQLFESLSSELKGVVSSRNRELRLIQEELRRSERQAKTVTENLKNYTKKLHNTENKLEDMTKQNETNLTESKHKEAKLDEAREEFSHLKAEFHAAQEELALRDRQISSHLITITEKGGKIAGLRIEKAELEKAYKELQCSLDVEKNKCGSLSRRVADLEGALEKTKEELRDCEEDLSMRSIEADSLNHSLTSAQADLMRMENIVTEREEEIKDYKKTIEKLELALERSKQQLTVLESHIDGHDTLLKDSREKEEALAIKTGELAQAEERLQDTEEKLSENQSELANSKDEASSLQTKVNSLEVSKSNLENELKISEEARSTAERTLSNTAAKLAAVENSKTEEVADLKATVNSLEKVLHEKESSLNSASETISQTSSETNLAKEQLIDSRTRGDRLFARLTATEYELASKKESLTALETRFNELKQSVQSKQADIEKLERELGVKNQDLISARDKIEDVTSKANKIAKGEFLTMQNKLEAKEKAIANLHNWCCFINGKLHAAEKALSQRDVDIEISSSAFKKLEAQVQSFRESLSEKEAEMRKLESSRVVENSELRSRIQSLQTHVVETNAELKKTKEIMSTNGKDGQSLVALTEELQNCKTQLKKKEMEMSEIQARSNSLRETLQTYEMDLAASKRTMESLTLDLGQLRSEVISKRKSESNNEKHAAMEVSKVRSETGYLLVELRKAEAELSAANQNAKMWQSRAEELQPLAESTVEAQRAVERISSQLSLSEKDSQHKIDLLETQLNEAMRERDSAERDCSSALADYSAMRTRLSDVHTRGSFFGNIAASNQLSTVTFTVEGPNAPRPDIMVYLIGADSTLGEWSVSRKLPVRVVGEGRYGILRKCDVVLSSNTLTEYKYAADGPDGSLVWEEGENRQLELNGKTFLTLHDTWRGV